MNPTVMDDARMNDTIIKNYIPFWKANNWNLKLFHCFNFLMSNALTLFLLYENSEALELESQNDTTVQAFIICPHFWMNQLIYSVTFCFKEKKPFSTFSPKSVVYLNWNTCKYFKTDLQKVLLFSSQEHFLSKYFH